MKSCETPSYDSQDNGVYHPSLIHGWSRCTCGKLDLNVQVRQVLPKEQRKADLGPIVGILEFPSEIAVGDFDAIESWTESWTISS